MDCGQKHIKYVHVLYHKEQDLTIHIGKECAVLHIHQMHRTAVGYRILQSLASIIRQRKPMIHT